jgi:hypothetical protein
MPREILTKKFAQSNEKPKEHEGLFNSLFPINPLEQIKINKTKKYSRFTVLWGGDTRTPYTFSS